MTPMQPNADATTGGPLRRTVTLTNVQGLHLRPMQAFVELAGKFQCAVRVSKEEGEAVDGRSMFGLMTLGAPQGTELTLEADGPDAPAALDALAALLAGLAAQEDGAP